MNGRGHKAIAGSAALALCAGMAVAAGAAQEPSGFLGDYSELKPREGDGSMLVYRKAEGALAAYDAFIVDPVLVWFHPEAKGRGVDPDDLKALADTFRTEVVEELEGHGYTVTSEPGPGVLRVRVAITDVDPAGPVANVAAKAGGVALGVPLLPSLDIGSAAIEAEMLDSTSGERLAAVMDAKRGRRFFAFKRSVERWGDARAAFRAWAREWRELLDEVKQRGGER